MSLLVNANATNFIMFESAEKKSIKLDLNGDKVEDTLTYNPVTKKMELKLSQAGGNFVQKDLSGLTSFGDSPDEISAESPYILRLFHYRTPPSGSGEPGYVLGAEFEKNDGSDVNDPIYKVANFDKNGNVELSYDRNSIESVLYATEIAGIINSSADERDFHGALKEFRDVDQEFRKKSQEIEGILKELNGYLTGFKDTASGRRGLRQDLIQQYNYYVENNINSDIDRDEFNRLGNSYRKHLNKGQEVLNGYHDFIGATCKINELADILPRTREKKKDAGGYF